MMALGPIGFLAPWMLLALVALPAIWWLLRFTPPSPNVVVFPPTRLLKDLKPTEETPARSPWWLTLLRMLLAALLILALARPVINPDRETFAGEGPLLLVVDNGWASAANWAGRREAIAAAIDRASRDGRTVLLAPTASDQPIGEPVPADAAQERITGLNPEPYAPDRAKLAAALDRDLATKTGYSVVWLSDGLDYGEGENLHGEPRQACGRRRQSHRASARNGRYAAWPRSSHRRRRRAGRTCSERHRRPAQRHGQSPDRTRRAARRSTFHHRGGSARSEGEFRSAARDPQSGGAHPDQGRALRGRRASARCQLAVAPRRHRLGRIPRGGAAAPVAALLCGTRSVALCRRHHTE